MTYSLAILHDRGNSVARITAPFKHLERVLEFRGGRKTVIVDDAGTVLYKWRNEQWVKRGGNK